MPQAMTERFLAGRGAVVTGGGRGIGAAVARTLAEAGAAVAVVARTAAEIEAVARQIESAGGKAWAIPCDVADEASVRRMAEEAGRALGTVDILVNNAGVGSSAPFARLTLEQWNRALAVMATGTFLCTRELAPAMAERGFGRVVNIASVAGLEGARYVAHYSAAKHAVVGFTRSVALELAGSGVTVNAVCPGYVDTAMTAETLARIERRAGLTRADALAAVLSTTGQERLVTPVEVAAAVLWLCREEEGDVTGQAVLIGDAQARPRAPEEAS
jgi:NAD(P)-dependent dehydrogenase (short-subunit alcohol dehydrogenase family)